MNTFVADQVLNTRCHRNRLNFALVIEEANSHRHSVIALLRDHGWLVHGVSCAEHAFKILVHIPYTLIVVDSELPGIDAKDFVRIVRTSGKRQPVQLVVINNFQSASLERHIAESDTFLARRSMWQEDLSGFLIADKGDRSA